MTPARANRVAVTLVATGLVALVVVLGLWQRVDAACSGSGFDPDDPVSTCQPPADGGADQVSADPIPAATTSR